MIRKTLKIGVLTSALLMAFPLIASAQSAADLKKEIDLLKGQIEALQKKVESQSAAPAAAAGAVDPDEFNRIKIKTESVEDNFEAAGLKGFKISGMMDPTFIYNQAQNTAGFQFLNNFSGPDEVYSYDNGYAGMVVLDIQKETEGGNRWRLTLAPHKSAGANFNFPSIVHEATVSIPLSDLQTRLWAGQLPDWSGYEYFLPNQNKLITHGLLFDFMAPTFYTAAGLDITRGKWQVKTALGNMNLPRKGVGPGEKTPTLSYRVDYSKGEFNGFGFAGQHGKEGGNSVNLFEVDGYFIRGDWTVQGQVGLGAKANSAANGGRAQWWGLSGLAAYKFSPRLEGVVRADYINNNKNGGGVYGQSYGNCQLYLRDSAGALVLDPNSNSPILNPDTTPCADGRNGFGPGMGLAADSGLWEPLDPNKGVNRAAIALGFNYLFNPTTSFKFELRHDRASSPAFIDTRDQSYRNSNTVVGSSVVVSF
jgi:Protein of unknown function (DUF3138)